MKYTGVVRIGHKDAKVVRAIKEVLNGTVNAGLDTANSTFGPSTEKAVMKFQKLKQLVQDGIIGELTWNRLFHTQNSVTIDSRSLKIRALQYVQSQLHVRELTGKNDGKEVEEYLASVGLGKGYAYCMALIFWAYQKASQDLGVENPLKKTGGVLKQWNETDEKFKVYKNPQKGDIFIMDFGKGTGHAGIVESTLNGRIQTVEGNTSSDPSLPAADREGNGNFARSRKPSDINKGFIRFA